MVSNLRKLPGIVSIDPASERQTLVVVFNADQTSPEAIVARLQQGGDEVTGWELPE